MPRRMMDRSLFLLQENHQNSKARRIVFCLRAMVLLAIRLLNFWQCRRKASANNTSKGTKFMRSIVLYALGVPVTIIVLIALFTHHF